MSAASGNGWCGKLVATWRKVPRALPMMHDAKQLSPSWRSSSTEVAFLTRIDPTRNINRFYVVQVMPSLFGDWTVMREWSGAFETSRRREALSFQHHKEVAALAGCALLSKLSVDAECSRSNATRKSPRTDRGFLTAV